LSLACNARSTNISGEPTFYYSAWYKYTNLIIFRNKPIHTVRRDNTNLFCQNNWILLLEKLYKRAFPNSLKSRPYWYFPGIAKKGYACTDSKFSILTLFQKPGTNEWGLLVVDTRSISFRNTTFILSNKPSV
jgi:hypothetical protein